MGYDNPKVALIHDQTVAFARSVYASYILGLMGRLMSSSRALADALYMGFTYMRWLDDICDESPMPMDDKLRLLSENIGRLRRWKDEELDEVALYTLRIEERCAYFFVKDSVDALRARGMARARIDEYLDNYFEMIASIEVDTRNHGRIMPDAECFGPVYYARAGVGFKTTPYLLLNDPSPRLIKAFEHFGYLWQLNNDNIGIAKDLSCDMYNMSREEIAKHRIDLEGFRGDYGALVQYLARETTFFEDRVERLRSWGSVVLDNIGELPILHRVLVRRAARLMMTSPFKPGSTHYDLLVTIYSVRSDVWQCLAWMAILLVPERLELFVLHNLLGVNGAASPAADAASTA